MGTRGPAPKPTALKKLAGNPGKRALNNAEPKPREGRPRMPAHMGDVAAKEWKRLVKDLTAMGVLTSIDADALAMYCDTYARWVEASRALNTDGMIIFTEKGYPIQSPYLSIINQCIKTMQALLQQFGMTPASRTRLQAPETKDDDPFDEFIRLRN
jgi:P27 family predicted phage terminase small subunit